MKRFRGIFGPPCSLRKIAALWQKSCPRLPLKNIWNKKRLNIWVIKRRWINTLMNRINISYRFKVFLYDTD